MDKAMRPPLLKWRRLKLIISSAVVLVCLIILAGDWNAKYQHRSELFTVARTSGSEESVDQQERELASLLSAAETDDAKTKQTSLAPAAVVSPPVINIYVGNNGGGSRQHEQGEVQAFAQQKLLNTMETKLVTQDREIARLLASRGSDAAAAGKEREARVLQQREAKLKQESKARLQLISELQMRRLAEEHIDSRNSREQKIEDELEQILKLLTAPHKSTAASSKSTDETPARISQPNARASHVGHAAVLQNTKSVQPAAAHRLAVETAQVGSAAAVTAKIAGARDGVEVFKSQILPSASASDEISATHDAASTPAAASATQPSSFKVSSAEARQKAVSRVQPNAPQDETKKEARIGSTKVVREVTARGTAAPIIKEIAIEAQGAKVKSHKGKGVDADSANSVAELRQQELMEEEELDAAAAAIDPRRSWAANVPQSATELFEITNPRQSGADRAAALRAQAKRRLAALDRKAGSSSQRHDALSYADDIALSQLAEEQGGSRGAGQQRSEHVGRLNKGFKAVASEGKAHSVKGLKVEAMERLQALAAAAGDAHRSKMTGSIGDFLPHSLFSAFKKHDLIRKMEGLSHVKKKAWDTTYSPDGSGDIFDDRPAAPPPSAYEQEQDRLIRTLETAAGVPAAAVGKPAKLEDLARIARAGEGRSDISL